MEYYNNKLYVLRMNTELTDVEIEEYELAKFPEMEAHFNNPQRNNGCYDIWKEREMVERCTGGKRIVNYKTLRSSLEHELQIMRQSLQNYKASVLKVEQILENCGLENIKHAKSMEKLDVCSFSDTFYVYGKSFLKLEYRLGHLVRTDTIITEYDIPNWKIEFIHSGNLSVYKRKELLKDEKTFDEWMRLIIKEPEGVVLKKAEIKDQIQCIFGIDIQVTDILYDFASQCFVLKEDVEKLVLKDILPQKSDEPDEIAKYTTLETLVPMLKSKKIRMNSIVSMNDKTETDFLEDYIRNYKEDYEDDLDKYLFADKEFITSFTTRIDDLDMWRLYGDNAHGVCMVFKRIKKENDRLYEIRYIDPQSNTLGNIMKFQNILKTKHIKFRLNLLKKFQHFIKHSDYSSEKEYRILVNCDKADGWFINRDNGILTPFIEKNIANDVKDVDEEYPFFLDRIILGPSSKEKWINMMQVFDMVAQCGYSLGVGVSQVISYR